MPSDTQYSKMSREQIASVIVTLTNEIASETAQVSVLSLKITELENIINQVPGGLQQQYNDAVFEYTSTSKEYIHISTLYSETISTYSSIMLEISRLRLLSTYTLSSLRALETEYIGMSTQYMERKSTLDADLKYNQDSYNKYINEYGKYTSSVSTYSTDIILYNDMSTLYKTGIVKYDDTLFDFTKVSSITGSNGKFTVVPSGSDGKQAAWTNMPYSEFDIVLNYISSQSYILMLSPLKGDVPSNKTGGSLAINVSNYSTTNIVIYNSTNSIVTPANLHSIFNLTPDNPLHIRYPSSISSILFNTALSTNSKYDFTIPNFLSEYYIGYIFNQKMTLPPYKIDTTKVFGQVTTNTTPAYIEYGFPYLATGVTTTAPWSSYAYSVNSFTNLSFTFMGTGVTVVLSPTNTGSPPLIPGITFGKDRFRRISLPPGVPVLPAAGGQSMINSYTFSYDGTNVKFGDTTFTPSWTRGQPVYIAFIFDSSSAFGSVSFPTNILRIMTWTGNPSPTIPNVSTAALFMSSFTGKQIINSTAQSSMSTSMHNYLSTIDYLSTYISKYDIDTLSKNISIAYHNLSISIELSSIFATSTSTFSYRWNELMADEAAIQSTISSYNFTYSGYLYQSSMISTQIAQYLSNLKVELTILDAGSSEFYEQKRTQILSEVEEYRYAIRERNAFLGVLTAELNIQRLNLYDTIDTIAFDIQSATDSDTISTFTANRIEVVKIQNTLQSEMSKINPINPYYSQVDSILDDEYTFKEEFMSIRSTLYLYERQVLEYPTQKYSIKSYYDTMWAQMNSTIRNVNDTIQYRTDILSTIKANEDIIKQDLLKYPLNKYTFDPFPPDFTYNNTPIPEQSKNPASVSEYAALKPIDFSRIL